MILFEDDAKARDRSFGASAKDIAELVKRYSVHLDGGAFVGSGVMVFCSTKPPCVYVLSAKHNLTVRGKPDRLVDSDWSKDKDIAALHKTFLEKVKIRVGGVSARISNIFYFGKDWTYDVCCLTSNDPDLYGLWTKPDSTLEALLWQGETDQALLRSIRGNDQAGLARQYHFVQAGFGCNRYKTGVKTRRQVDVDPNVRGTLNHRDLTLTDYWAEAHDYDDEADESEDIHCVAAAGASETATSAPGDSGGGVFAYKKSSRAWMVAGVNKGANMSRDADDPIQQAAIVQNNVFTVLDSRVLNPTEAGTFTVLKDSIVSASKDEAFARFWSQKEAVGVGQESEVEPEPVTSG